MDREIALRWALWSARLLRWKDFRHLLEISENELSSGVGWGRLKGSGLPHARKVFELISDGGRAEEKLAEDLARSRARLLYYDDVEYPQVFRDLDEPPAFLWCKGQGSHPLPDSCVSIVGMRKVDCEGARLASSYSRQIAARGYTIVSGGALGVDAIAHRGALEVGQRTIVYLPGGVDVAAPRQNRVLFEEIVEGGGLLISEYPPGTQPRRYHFHRRNLLIAASSRRVLVVRAGQRGGTMITADWARRLGRELYVLPGSPDDPGSRGSLSLISGGATMVMDVEDIVGQEGIEEASGPVEEEREESFTCPQHLSPLMSALSRRLARRCDELVVEVEWPVHQIHAGLTRLELMGLVAYDGASGGFRRLV